MTETDYTEGDEPVEIGAIVEYFGSHRAGRYEITGHRSPESRLLMGPAVSPELLRSAYPKVAYTDGVAYDLWPVGVPIKFGHRGDAVYWVRRTSFRRVEEESEQ